MLLIVAFGHSTGAKASNRLGLCLPLSSSDRFQSGNEPRNGNVFTELLFPCVSRDALGVEQDDAAQQQPIAFGIPFDLLLSGSPQRPDHRLGQAPKGDGGIDPSISKSLVKGACLVHVQMISVKIIGRKFYQSLIIDANFLDNAEHAESIPGIWKELGKD